MANKKTSDYDALPSGVIASSWEYDIGNPTVKNYKGTHAEVSQNVADEAITGLDTTASSLKGAINENFDRVEVVNGHILETINLAITSNGSVITASLDASTGNILTFAFSTGLIPVDVTTPKTVALTAGSDTIPQENWLYVLRTDPTTLVASIIGFPDDATIEYAPIGRVIVQSAATVMADGVIKQHNYTDHIRSDGGIGHLHCINEWIRERWACYKSGVAQTITGSGTATVTYAVTSGTVKQLHTQIFPALANPATLYVVNDSVTPYKQITNIGGGILLDSTGATLNNRYYNLVIWGIASQSGAGQSKLFLNLPSGSYATQTGGEEDLSKFTDFGVPQEYKGAAFLIARILIKNLASTSFTVIPTDNDDLRGEVPNGVAGTSTAVGVEFPDGAMRVFNTTDVTKKIAFDASGITTGNVRTITAADRDLDLANPVFDSIDMAGDIDMNANKNIYGVGTDVVQTIMTYNNASTAKPVVKFSPTIGGISNYHGTHLEVTETAKAAGNHLESHGAGANDIISSRAAAYSLNRYMGYMSTGQLQSGTRRYWGEEYDSSTGNLTFKTINDSTVTNRFRIDFATGVLSALTTNYASLITADEHLVNKAYVDASGGDGFRDINGRNIPSVFNGMEKMGASAYEEAVSRTSWAGADGLYMSTVALLNSNIFIAYDDDSSGKAGTLAVRSMIGVSIESAIVFEAGETTYIDTTLLLNGNVAVSYIDVDDSNKLKFVIYDEDAVEVVAPVTVHSGQAIYTAITTLQNGNFVVAFTDIDESNYAKFYIFNQAGEAVVFESMITSVFTSFIGVATLTDGNILFTYNKAGAGHFTVVSEDGAITIVSETLFESGNSKYIKPVALTNGTFMIVYQDDDANDFGKRVVHSAGGSQLLAPTTYAAVAVQQNLPVVLHNGNVLVSYEAGVTGDMELVILDVAGRLIQDRTVFDSDANLKPVSAPVALINGNVFIPFADTNNRYVIWQPV